MPPAPSNGRTLASAGLLVACLVTVALLAKLRPPTLATTGRTTILQGVISLVIFGVYLFTAVVP